MTWKLIISCLFLSVSVAAQQPAAVQLYGEDAETSGILPNAVEQRKGFGKPDLTALDEQGHHPYFPQMPGRCNTVMIGHLYDDGKTLPATEGLPRKVTLKQGTPEVARRSAGNRESIVPYRRHSPQSVALPPLIRHHGGNATCHRFRGGTRFRQPFGPTLRQRPAASSLQVGSMAYAKAVFREFRHRKRDTLRRDAESATRSAQAS
jgi:hypothetical protein